MTSQREGRRRSRGSASLPDLRSGIGDPSPVVSVPIAGMATRFQARDIALAGLLCALNAALEITVGGALHSVRFPLAGSVMVALNVSVYAVAHALVGRKGFVLLIGLASALLSLFAGPGPRFGIALAVAIECGFFVLGLDLLGRGRAGHALGAALATAWISVHPFLVALFIAGRDATEALLGYLRGAGAFLGLETQDLWGLLGILTLLRFLVGSCAGFFAYRLAIGLRSRLLADPRWRQVLPAAAREGIRVAETPRREA